MLVTTRMHILKKISDIRVMHYRLKLYYKMATKLKMYDKYNKLQSSLKKGKKTSKLTHISDWVQAFSDEKRCVYNCLLTIRISSSAVLYSTGILTTFGDDPK